MNERQQRQFGSTGNLYIKGTGYVNSSNTRSQSSSHKVSSSGSKLTPPRSVSQFCTSTMSAFPKSSSIGNIRNLATSPHNSKKNRTCPNRHNDYELSTAHLQDQYTRKLQQQIHLLELENNYLKSGIDKNSGNNDENNSYCSEFSLAPSSLTLNLDVSRRKESLGAEALENDKEKLGRSGKRVSYANPEVTKSFDFSRTRKPPLCSVGQAELLQKLEESYQEIVANEIVEIRVDMRIRIAIKIRADRPDILMHNTRERNLEECLKQKSTEIERIAYENSQLSEYIQELKDKFQKSEENFTRDKRALMEETVELQRRLDYLTPALADKESYVAKVEGEKDELIDKLRYATNQLNEIQIKEKMLLNAEEGRKNENDWLQRTIQRLNNTIKELKMKESALIDEVTEMKQILRKEQLAAKKDKAVAEKTLEENNVLIKENAQLSAQLSRLEMRIKSLNQEAYSSQKNSDMNSAEITQLQESKRQLKTELLQVQEKLEAEKDRCRNVANELEQYRKAEEDIRNSRGRMQKELDALKTLSESISNDNKSLRQEKFALTERCEELLKMMDAKTKEVLSLRNEINKRDDELQCCREECENSEKHYRATLDELDKQILMRQEKSNDYEDLAKRVLELSNSVKDKSQKFTSIATQLSSLSSLQSDRSTDDHTQSLSYRSGTPTSTQQF